ncbi:MAG TPA: lmo0937 family membrane protein [Candidatus Paceibacterota bacterium]|nr:lmo0937 family membrane protein [Candidatus Paceibacterota bacterium]
MLTTIAAVLIVLWLIGYIGFPVLGSFVHILLLIAVIFFLIRIIRGENPLK